MTRVQPALLLSLLSLHGARAGAAPPTTLHVEAPVLLVHAGKTPGEAADRTRVTAALRRELSFRGRRIRVRGAPDLERELHEAERTRKLALARRRAQEGARLLGRLKLDRAIRALRAGLDAYAAFLPDETLCAEMVSPLRNLAFALWQQGDDGAAMAAAVLAGGASLPPSPVDTARYPPPFVSFMRRLHTVRPVTVKLPRLPPGAQIHRGCARGALSPREQLEVTGSVPLRVSAPGHRDWSGLVFPGGGDTVVLAALEPLAPLWRRPAAELDQLLDHAGAGWVVFWRREGKALETRRHRRGSAGPSPWQHLRQPPPEEVKPPPPTVRRDALGTRLAPGLLAVGAGALVAGTILGVMARSAANEIREAADQERPFDERLAELDDRRHQFGTAAYVLWGVGGAASAGAVVWWVLALRAGGRRERTPAVSVGPAGVLWTRRF